ncbi:unnamed protein product [Gemmataceae bacterium]|nr:unnamed protein product [Gemmataceae bacterium]VTT98360.1 unnamed protein product [Gemmataceae bacterium]
MRGLILLASGALLVSACDRGRAPSLPDVKVAAPTDEAAARAYRDRVAAFLEEARSGAKLLTLSPGADEVRRRADRVTELLAQVPHAPAGTDPGGETADRLRRIREAFESARLQLAAADTRDAAAARRLYQDRLPALAGSILSLSGEAEARATRGAPAK